tara:strand:- start:394 stop:657 length:264 start_codon:yes stop_codon:yes gene_type:complete
MKFSTEKQKLEMKYYTEKMMTKTIWRIQKRFAWLPVADSKQTFWLEYVYINQELARTEEDFFFNSHISWIDKTFSTEEKYEQYLKEF